jgi:hypothetical protein
MGHPVTLKYLSDGGQTESSLADGLISEAQHNGEEEALS